MIGKIVGGVVTIIIGIALVPEISKEVALATNMTGSVPPSALKLVPGFFALGILGIGIAIAYGGLRDAGLFGYSDEYKEDYKKDKKKLGTYEEYVRERLKVERMMKYGWLGRWI